MRIFTLALVALALAACDRNLTPGAQDPRALVGPDYVVPVVASGDTWDLGFGRIPLRPAAPCFALDDLRGSYILCTNLVYPELGSGVVEPLGSEGSLVFGTISTRVATVEVALEDGSVVATNPFAPPETATIERNLFALEIDQRHGSAVATPLDRGGRRLATAEFRWEEDAGGTVRFEAL
jgi:hypothetical protein